MSQGNGISSNPPSTYYAISGCCLLRSVYHHVDSKTSSLPELGPTQLVTRRSLPLGRGGGGDGRQEQQQQQQPCPLNQAQQAGDWKPFFLSRLQQMDSTGRFMVSQSRPLPPPRDSI